MGPAFRSILFSRHTQVTLDLAVLSIAFWLAFGLRFDWSIPPEMLKRAWVLWAPVVLLQYGFLWLLEVPRFSWRHVGLREVLRIATAAGTAAAILTALRLLLPLFAVGKPLLAPLGVIGIDAVLVVFMVGGIRVLRRVLGERSETESRRATGRVSTAKRVVLLGAGQAGAMVAREISTRPDLGLKPVGFLDDDPRKQGLLIHGLGVLGRTEDLVRLKDHLRIEQAIITIANAPGEEIRRIARTCEAAGLTPKIVPGLYELVGGRIELSRIRRVDIEDLLRREPVRLDETSIRAAVAGQVVLVTGAGGSIGSELCRQIARFDPARLVLFERSENALYEIHRELEGAHAGLSLVPILGDVGDRPRLDGVLRAHRPAVIFHAAAHKHVPMVEWNPGEALKNNVLGTKTLAEAASEHGVGTFVLISTDKAVNPTSVMGATKRAAELVIQALAATSDTRFVTVRFGNVLGSAGSVVPLFKEQIARGGPVTVTHPEMRRYFMTIPEACQLVLQAGIMGQGGEIFVLDMGAPVKIVDLAKDLIRLSGFAGEVAIEFTGLRPGEKLFEELSLSNENADKTRHPKIWVGKIPPPIPEEVGAHVADLARLADRGTPEELRAKLAELVPEYRGPVPTPATAKIGRAPGTTPTKPAQVVAVPAA